MIENEDLKCIIVKQVVSTKEKDDIDYWSRLFDIKHRYGMLSKWNNNFHNWKNTFLRPCSQHAWRECLDLDPEVYLDHLVEKSSMCLNESKKDCIEQRNG